MKKLFTILLVLVCANVIGQSQINGTITYDNTANTPIQLADVNLRDALNSIIATTTTDHTGYYSFNAIPNGNYTIEIIANYTWGGVNTTDALLVNRYYIGIYNFKDLLTKKAADVNIDNNINTLDALFIIRRYIQMTSSFKAGDWLVDDNNINVNGQNITKNIKMICTGDVDGSYIPVYKFANCGDNLVDSRDGKAYKTVQIGNQCWMQQNMNIGNRIDGGKGQTDNGIIEKYCYNDSTKYCDIYGGLYQWWELMQYVTTEKTNGICPTGWHIPADAEWTMLTDYLGGDSVAGGKMKTTGTIEAGTGLWHDPNAGATNSSGFTALPGGVWYDYEGFFAGLGLGSSFWSSTEDINSSPSIIVNYNSNKGTYKINISKADANSVRCLKNCPPINAPGSGTNIPSYSQIIWNWQTVAGATGYKWSTTNDYSSAIDIGTTTSYAQQDLDCNTSYTLYVWAYYNNQSCYNNSFPITLTQQTTACPAFDCGNNLVDSRNGQTYKTVQIGNQCWFQENLNIGKRIDGINNQTNNSTIEKYCYNDSTKYCDIYGGLYQWDEMMQYVTTEKAKGICPTGWHISTNNEWTTLERDVCSSITCSSDFPYDNTTTGWRGTDEGGKMKEAGTTHWNSPNIGATNSSGFTVLPGGLRDYFDGTFHNLGYYSSFWSSTEQDGTISWSTDIAGNQSYVGRFNDSKSNGFSVRCIKDCPSINAPGSGTNVPSQEQIIWNWQAVQGATGYKWSTTNNYSTATDNSISSSYTQSGLTCNTSYTLYVWAYYNNQSCGNYSTVTTLTQHTNSCPPFINCGDYLTDSRDGESYKTVQIGTQCWFKENLNVGTRINGTSEQTNNSTIEKYCYDNFESNCNVYGGLYQWNELMQYVTTEKTKGICPTGWHVPADAEWTVLTDYLGGGGYVAGGKMKEAGTTHWSSPNTGADNSSGFTALPGGYRFNLNGSFGSQGLYGHWWSATEHGDTGAWRCFLDFRNPLANLDYNPKTLGFSVRCLKD